MIQRLCAHERVVYTSVFSPHGCSNGQTHRRVNELNNEIPLSCLLPRSESIVLGLVWLEGIEGVLPFNEIEIRLNFNFLMVKYVTGGNLEAWIRRAASIIDAVAQATEMLVYLIPHVTNPDSNDHEFMQRALSFAMDRDGNITLISSEYDAAETKWIISQMTLFAGARTHSTIVALSTNVPTLSFAYSIKAQGINQDIFGHTDYCMEPTDLDAGVVAARVALMLDERATIRRDLAGKTPGVQRAALSAGKGLKRLIGVN